MSKKIQKNSVLAVSSQKPPLKNFKAKAKFASKAQKDKSSLREQSAGKAKFAPKRFSAAKDHAKAGIKERAVDKTKYCGKFVSKRGSKFEGKFATKPEYLNKARFEHKEAQLEPMVEIAEEGVRIAKYLARCGIASRREAEIIILDGRITVDGKKIDNLATRILQNQVILLDGRPIAPPERTRLWLYHKPAGLITSTRDKEGRPTIFDNLPKDLPRLVSVGRLDINTEGLLLLTNDGGLSRMLELPNTGWLRRYRVRAFGSVKQSQLDELKNGLVVDGIFYGSIIANLEREQGSNLWLNVALREGKNREVKNILAHLGLKVNRLIRVSFGPFQLGDLAPGEVQEIKGRHLREQLGDRIIAESNANFDLPIRIRREDNLSTEDEIVAKDTRRGDLRCRSANVWRDRTCFIAGNRAENKTRNEDKKRDKGDRKIFSKNKNFTEKGNRKPAKFGEKRASIKNNKFKVRSK